ncbi:MAG TPA: phosphoribosylformylglycinamidine synthase subunit PurS [Candidatus Acidoferrum sp.]|nr:phosphoribosylformylglycinamidine synthase subunit PurS [Candidatus Acidoferrum sp.]
MLYHANITIKLKKGMLDPEATTIKKALKHLGYNCDNLKTAILYELEFEAESKDKAKGLANEMCLKLLANPIIHDYSIELQH